VTTTTCIAALKTGNGVWMIGDSAGVDPQSLSIRIVSGKKVFLKTDSNGQEFGFGYTSSFRMGQLIQYSLTVPPVPAKGDLQDYMCTTFVEALRTCLKDGGYTKISDNQETGGYFLVGTAGRIFEIQSDFQVCETVEDYAAVGCGDDLALGSLFSTQDNHLDEAMQPWDRLRLALDAAAHFSAGVRPPFNLIEVKK
jgi:hypothetical protein